MKFEDGYLVNKPTDFFKRVHQEGTSKEEWGTPMKIYRELDAEFHFDLDPCTSEDNPLGTVFYFTKEEDGLKTNWEIPRMYMKPGKIQTVFMNPPYARYIINKWVKKARDESMKGLVIVALLPARTSTRWWHDYIWDEVNHQPRPGVEVRLRKGRIKFVGSKNSAPFPSAIVIFNLKEDLKNEVPTL